MKKILVSTLACSMAMGLFAAGTANAIQVYLSPQNETDIGVNPIDVPVNHHASFPDPSGSGVTNVWVANPDDDPDNNEVITGIALNIVSTTPGVIKFTGVNIYNPHMDIGFLQDDRWQGTGNGVLSDNSIMNFNSANVNSGFGMDPGLAGVDPLYDPDADAWLFATVSYDVIGAGETDLFLQVGNNGIATNQRNSSQVQFEFGGGDTPEDGSAADPTLNGESQRNLSSATRDGSVFAEAAIPEPTSLVLMMLGFVGAGLFSRRRS